HVPIWTGMVLRFIVFRSFPGIVELLDQRPETATPVSSYKRLLEACFLFDHGLNPYEQDLYHASPLMLALFSKLSPVISMLLFFLIDYGIARMLMIGVAHWKDTTKPMDYLIDPNDVATLYLLNPYSVLVCISQNIQLIESLCIMGAFYFAIKNKRYLSGLCVAIATYQSLYPIVILAPCCLFLSKTRKIPVQSALAQLLLPTLFFLGGLLYLSHLLIGDWSFLKQTYGTIILVTDLKPNVGLHWYFFMEVFDQFRQFFTPVLHLNAFVFAVPIAIYFHKYPTFVAGLTLGFVSIFKSYPTIADAALYLPILLSHTEIVKYCHYSYFSIVSLMYASILGPMFYNLWVYSGSGNANFFYAITLVYSLAQVIIVVDMMYALVQREWDQKHPGWRRMRVQLIQ
ncbi:GPI transamidase subunit PIG-U, partial [Gorgonomyces haynaldii]